MLVILKNKTNSDMNIRVHSGELVNVKKGSTLVVSCEHERFPYYASLKRAGVEVKVNEIFAVVDAEPIVAESTIVETSKVEEAKVEEAKVEEVVVENVKVEKTSQPKTHKSVKKATSVENTTKVVNETADATVTEVSSEEQNEVDETLKESEVVEETTNSNLTE